MYIVGIDIGKNNHEASIIDSKGILIGKSCRFSNTHKGADKLMTHIAHLIGDSPCVFGMEATGHYWYSIYSFLKTKGYTIYVINPIQSDCLRSMYIRQTKNDSKDSFLIAQVIRFGQFTTTSLADEDLLSLRQLCRYHDSVISARTEIKLRIHTIMDQIFLNLISYSLLYGETHPLQFCKRISRPRTLQKPQWMSLFSILKDKSHNRITISKAIEIKEAAANTFGIKIAQSAFSFQLKQLFERLDLLNNQIETLENEIAHYYKKFDCNLHTIPGIGLVAAASILAEIGDIRRFKNASALVAYAGIDPSVKQSGEFNSIHNHMSKRGSPYLRHAVFLAAATCTFHESPLNEYYKKKREQGKHHLTAIGAVSNKLTSIIYAILRDGTPYEAKRFPT